MLMGVNRAPGRRMSGTIRGGAAGMRNPFNINSLPHASSTRSRQATFTKCNRRVFALEGLSVWPVRLLMPMAAGASASAP